MSLPPPLDDDLPPSAAAMINSGPDSQVALDELIAKATAKYAVRDYATAAELYSRATELQAELNGEMSTRNADLLYLYGRCLYHVAVQNSDVLGTKVTGSESQPQKKSNSQPKEDKLQRNSAESACKDNTLMSVEAHVALPNPVTIDSVATNIATTQESDRESTSKPYFSITGDENWDDSEDELAGDGNEGGDFDEEPEDDFSNAFEVLDIARVLLEKRLAELKDAQQRQEREDKVEAVGKTILEITKLREKLADTRDLQAEISLEAERFADAAVDLRAALDMKKNIFPFESSVVAEAHYKLSLALEFSSITPAVDEEGQPQPGTVGKIDQKLRDEAAEHMAEAIKSCNSRIEREEKILAELGSGQYVKEVVVGDGKKTAKITPESVQDVKDMVVDMKQRLDELREAPISINEATNKPAPEELSGLLGSLIGTSPEAQRAKLEEAVGRANDLSGLVKKKRPAQREKRKAEEELPTRDSSEKRSKESK